MMELGLPIVAVDLPSGANDEFTTAEDTPLVVAAPGVLANQPLFADFGEECLSRQDVELIANPFPELGVIVLRPRW